MPTPVQQQLDECLRLLRVQREPLLATRDEALATADEANRLLKQIDRAIAGLQPPRVSAAPSDASPKRPCSTKREVLAITQQTLRERGETPSAELKELIAQQVRGRGKSLAMFAKLFESCLDDPSLTKSSAGVVGLRPGSGWTETSRD